MNDRLQKITNISVERQELNKKKLIETKDIELYNILMSAEGKWFSKKFEEIITDILNGKDK